MMCAIRISLAVFVLLVCHSGARADPGVKATVTEQLLREILNEEVEAMRKDLEGRTFPSISGKSGSAEYSLWNIKLSPISGMTSHLDLQAPQTVYWSGGIDHVEVEADFRVKYKVFFVKFSFSGTVTATAKGIRLSLSTSLSAHNGQLVIGLNRCAASIGSINLKFSRSLVSWILNIFSDVFEGKVEDELRDSICEAVNKEFTSLTENMKSLKTRHDIKIAGLPLTLDASFAAITVTHYDITVLTKGDIIRYGRVFDSHNSGAGFLPTSGNSLSIGLQMDAINNVIAAAADANALDGELSYEELKRRDFHFFSLYCPKDICIGNAFKRVASQFPGRLLGMHWSIEEGRLEVGSNMMLGRLTGRVFFNAEDATNSTYLFSASMNITVPFQIRFSGNRISAKAVGLGGLILIDESLIGKVLSPNVQFLVQRFILPYLRRNLTQIINDYETDYKLPLPKYMSFRQSKISLHPGLVQVEADVCYKTFCAFTGNASWVGTNTTEHFDVRDVIPEPSTTTTTTTTTIKPITSPKIPGAKNETVGGQTGETSGQYNTRSSVIQSIFLHCVSFICFSQFIKHV